MKINKYVALVASIFSLLAITVEDDGKGFGLTVLDKQKIYGETRLEADDVYRNCFRKNNILV